MASTGYRGMPCPATSHAPPPLLPSLQRNRHAEESQTLAKRLCLDSSQHAGMEKGDCLAYPPHSHVYGASYSVLSLRQRPYMEGCTSPDRPADGEGLSCILPFFNVERLVLIPVATIKTRDTVEAAKLTSLTLCISIHSLTSFGSYLHGLSLPRIHSFALIYLGTYIGNVVDHRPVVPFVRRCASSLQDLIFDKLPLRPLGLAEILTPLRELRNLTVHEPTVSLLSAYYPISEAFLLNFHHAHFLPSLASVDLQLHSASTVERSMINGIVKERTLRTLDAGEAFSLRRRVIPYFEQEAVRL